MKQVWLILVLGFISEISLGQVSNVEVDSLTDEQIEYDFYHKTKFELELSQTNTWLKKGINVKVRSLNIGLQFNRNYKFGVSGILSKRYQTTYEDYPEIGYFETSLLGFGTYFEYLLIKNYRLEVGFPLAVGKVWATNEAYSTEKTRIPASDFTSNGFGLFSIGANGEYSINYWLAFGLGLGYRFSIGANSNTSQNLSTPYYSFGIKLQLGKFVKTIFHHEQVLQMKSIYFRDRRPAKSEKMRKRSENIYNRKASKK